MKNRFEHAQKYSKLKWEEGDIVAAGVLIVNPYTGKVLSFARKSNPANRAIIGGKIDEGEDPIEAANREAEEESGLLIPIEELQAAPVFVRLPNDRPHACATFLIFRTKLPDCDYRGSTPDEGYASWVEPEEMLGVECVFADYSSDMLWMFGLLEA